MHIATLAVESQSRLARAELSDREPRFERGGSAMLLLKLVLPRVHLCREARNAQLQAIRDCSLYLWLYPWQKSKFLLVTAAGNSSEVDVARRCNQTSLEGSWLSSGANETSLIGPRFKHSPKHQLSPEDIASLSNVAVTGTTHIDIPVPRRRRSIPKNTRWVPKCFGGVCPALSRHCCSLR